MEDKSHRRLKQNNFHLVDAVRVLAAVEDNKGPLTLVLFSLKLVKADGEMLSELLALGQILKQQLVVVLSGQSGGLVIAKNYRVSCWCAGSSARDFILAWRFSMCGRQSCNMR
jgi:hypothetical protein